MSEYTPTTAHIRDAWSELNYLESKGNIPYQDSGDEFDRWLAEVERASAEKAWDEARAALRYEDDTPVELVSMVNPYRREEA